MVSSVVSSVVAFVVASVIDSMIDSMPAKVAKTEMHGIEAPGRSLRQQRVAFWTCCFARKEEVVRTTQKDSSLLSNRQGDRTNPLVVFAKIRLQFAAPYLVRHSTVSTNHAWHRACWLKGVDSPRADKYRGLPFLVPAFYCLMFPPFVAVPEGGCSNCGVVDSADTVVVLAVGC